MDQNSTSVKATRRRFVVVSGLPGSGKSTLAGRLAPTLNLRLIDKDEILEHLFESRGLGDAAWRRALSRESDVILQQQAESSDGAILVSFWRVAGMALDSGTPTEWLSRLPGSIVINVHCHCEPEVAADRFLRRKRHTGHLDAGVSHREVLARFRKLSRLGPLNIEPRIDIDTSREPDLDDILCEISAVGCCTTSDR